MKTPLKLSILITSYNRPDSLQQCLNAIEAAQISFPYEVIVSDDASRKENLERIRNIKGITQLLESSENYGLGSNLNKVIKASKGEFILYCQEDFLLDSNIEPIILEAIDLITKGRLDMVRLKANYRFKKVIPLSANVSRIPHFSLDNFLINTFQYSDNPFISTRSFFEELDYFLTGVKSDYGENEFAIRVLNYRKKIGITNRYFAHTNKKSASTLRNSKGKNRKFLPSQKLKKILRAFRLHFEWLLYSKKRRTLVSYSKK